MKRKNNLLHAALIVLSLVVGFVIGISVNYPKVNNRDISGTIGKVNKHRDVSITDADIQLRSELVGDKEKCEGYLNYYAFHYTTAAQLTALTDSAIVASEQNTNFTQENAQVINHLKTYRKQIQTPRAELLLAVLTLQNIEDVEEAAIGTILNNANMAIARLTYNENAIASFTSAAQEYISKHRDAKLNDLIAVHDKLSMLQFSKAVITKDKPMIKYYDKHTIFSDKENLINVGAFSNETLKQFFINDSENLMGAIYNDQDALNSNNNTLGTIWSSDPQQLKDTEELLGSTFNNIENLGLFSNERFNSQINGNLNSEQLQYLFANTEQLQFYCDVEQLGKKSGGF